MRSWILISALLLSPAAAPQAIYVPAPNGQPPDEKTLELLKQQLAAGSPGVDPSTICTVDDSDIRAEKAASDDYFRRKLKGQVVPLQHQYEQELYYRDRRAKWYEETCGKPPKRERVPGMPDPTEMTMQACKAIGVVCKPVKHW